MTDIHWILVIALGTGGFLLIWSWLDTFGRCTRCQGDGFIQTWFGPTDCPRCDGTGKKLPLGD